MILTKQNKNKIEHHTGEIIDSLMPVGGGCISNSQIVKCKSGKAYFLKVNKSSNDMFLKEASGLRELKKANIIRVPEIILVEDNFILLENISSANRGKNFFEDFGRALADLHRFNSPQYGFTENNYIGLSPQLNTPLENNWKKFYWEKRIIYQIKLCQQNGYLTEELRNVVSRLENQLDKILEGSEETASLLHGDLWSGNFITDENGNACLIDPAVYYGNREADLAMTKLFGGFNFEFYRAYNESYPLPHGYNYRENFYKLYHVLNHLNLFGGGYYAQALSLINYYL